MSWNQFAGQKIGLLGAGKENLSLVPHLLKVRAIVTVCDARVEPELKEWAKKNPTVKLIIGDNYLEHLDLFDVVFRSPGMPVATLDKALSGISHQPIRKTATDFFIDITPVPVIGVTGTKGKGTTSSMLASILKAAKKHYLLVGNIGESVFNEIESLTKDSLVVMELSSFQLEDIGHSPDIAIVVPIFTDHLQPLSDRSPNFHVNMESYVTAKANITHFQNNKNWCIFVADNQYAHEIGVHSIAQKIAISTNVGSDYQIVGSILKSEDHPDCDLSVLSQHGPHIFLDASLAVAAARVLGIDEESISRGLKTFMPLRHRMEKVAEINKVTYIDDSYATAPEAAMAAIAGFTEPIIWIGGGSKKGADFNQLAETIAKSLIKEAILIGEEAPRLDEALRKHHFQGEIEHCQSLEKAVLKAKKSVKSGDVVLLSPACASKDMFKNAAERGDMFKKLLNI